MTLASQHERPKSSYEPSLRSDFDRLPDRRILRIFQITLRLPGILGRHRHRPLRFGYEAEPRASIEFYRFATGHLSHVLTLEKKAARLQPSLSATVDGKTVYYTQYDRQSVIKLEEFAR